MVREIVLTKGKVAIIDDEDFEEVSKYKWFAVKHRDTFYAFRCGKDYSFVNMSHQVLGNKSGKVIDHINRNGLDNRRCNLRFCSVAENCRNSKFRSNNKSGFRGVSWCSSRKKWEVRCGFDFCGYFDDKVEGAKAYDKKAKELFGDFAILNFPEIE